MNIVLVDSGQLAGEPEFPAVNLPKFAWLEYVALSADEIAERCWRADVIVSVNTPIDAEVITDTYKLKLIVVAGENTDHIDKAAAKVRGVMICNVPILNGDGLNGDELNGDSSQKIANQVVDNIHAWLDASPINIIE